MCASCYARINRPPASCHWCGASRAERGGICIDCSKRTGVDGLWAHASYEGVAAALVVRYKNNGMRAGVSHMVAGMCVAMPDLSPHSLIVPVPSTASRVRERGFDHTLLLARELARVSGMRWCAALRRTGSARQVGASRKVRRAQMRHTPYVPRPRKIAGRHVVLIDDVITTGATVEAAVQELRAASALSVSVVVFARTPL